MSDESIELFKPYTPEKMKWPARLSEKLDGVPIRMRKMAGRIFMWSRQNELIVSVPHLEPYGRQWLEEGGSLIGELYHPNLTFPQISGLVRKKEPTPASRGLRMYVHDADMQNIPGLSYEVRMGKFEATYDAYLKEHQITTEAIPIYKIPYIEVYDAVAAQAAFDMIMSAKPGAEGCVLRSCETGFTPGKRLWTGQKMKPQPTIDLEVLSVEEAISTKTGKPLEMVGRINCRWWEADKAGKLVEKTTGVGPGALTHNERKLLWQHRDRVAGRVIEVKYMRDEAYDGLRQPTYVRFRPDRVRPNQERGV